MLAKNERIRCSKQRFDGWDSLVESCLRKIGRASERASASRPQQLTESPSPKAATSKKSSKYLGVHLDKTSRNHPWRVTGYLSSMKVNIGKFSSEESAARAYDEWAMGIHGKRLNFNSLETVVTPKASAEKNVTTKTSQYRGVSYGSARRKWSAAIRISGQRINLGRFESEEDAARAYDAQAQKIVGRPLNFGPVSSQKMVDETDETETERLRGNAAPEPRQLSRTHGVDYDHCRGKWRARGISEAGIEFIGRYATEEEATRAVDAWACQRRLVSQTPTMSGTAFRCLSEAESSLLQCDEAAHANQLAASNEHQSMQSGFLVRTNIKSANGVRYPHLDEITMPPEKKPKAATHDGEKAGEVVRPAPGMFVSVDVPDGKFLGQIAEVNLKLHHSVKILIKNTLIKVKDLPQESAEYFDSDDEPEVGSSRPENIKQYRLLMHESYSGEKNLTKVIQKSCHLRTLLNRTNRSGAIRVSDDPFSASGSSKHKYRSFCVAGSLGKPRIPGRSLPTS